MQTNHHLARLCSVLGILYHARGTKISSSLSPEESSIIISKSRDNVLELVLKDHEGTEEG